MRKFRFRLEALRRLAQSRERMQRVRLARAEIRVARAQEELRRRESSERSLVVLFEARRQAGASPAELIGALDAIGVKEDAIEAAKGEVERRDGDAGRERDVLDDRRVARRVLDRLRERCWLRHEHERFRQEQVEADDRAARRKEMP